MTGHKGVKQSFDVNKAISAIGYLVYHTESTMYSVLKMMYLADKIHLERYGRFIAGDTYVAMEQGPVPSHAYDLIKCVRGEELRRNGNDIVCEYFIYGANHKIALRKATDDSELSDSDIECLSEIAAVYNQIGQWAVRDMAHDDAWRNVWPGTGQRKSVSMSVEAIASQFEASQQLIDHLRDSTPGEARHLPSAKKQAATAGT